MWFPPNFFPLVNFDWTILLFAPQPPEWCCFCALLGGGAFLGGLEQKLLLFPPCTERMLLWLHSKKLQLWRFVFSPSGTAPVMGKEQVNYKKTPNVFPVIHLVLGFLFKFEHAFKNCSVRQLIAPRISDFKRRYLWVILDCIYTSVV